MHSKYFLTLVICLLFIDSCAFSQNTKLPKVLHAVVSEIQTAKPKNKHGFQIHFRTKDNLYSISSGNATSTKKITSETKFNIGSTSKTFTAIMVMNLVDKGILSLEDKVIDYFSSNLKIDSTITIKNLLNHTSGIGEFIHDSLMNTSFVNPKINLPAQNEIISRITQNESPNIKHDYCNSNYFLLSEIIEKILDKPYLLVLQDFIENNKLNNTHPTTGRFINNLAHPYHSGIDLYNNINTHYYTRYCKGAGGICSTSSDVSLLFYNLFNHKIVSEETLHQMKINAIDKHNYGLGIQKRTIHSTEYWGHAGDNVGYSSRVYYSPKHNYTVSILYNCSDYPFIKETAHHILKAINTVYLKP